MTIRRLRLVAFLGFLLLVAASGAVTFAALRAQRDDALVVNLAGRQRMLIQKMTLEVLGVQVGANPAYREQLHTTAHDHFEHTLDALIAGGPAPYTGGVTVTLPPTRNPEILVQLETVRANWEEMHAAIHTVLESDPQGSAFAAGVAAVERLSPLMLAQMDKAVRLYEAEAARKVARVQSIQIGFLAAATVLLVAALALTERWVLAPIARLGAAARRIGAGDLDTPVPVAGPGEISRLARSFDDMRRNLAAADISAHLLDSMLDAVVVANPDGTVRMMNRAALELLGYTAAEVAGEPAGRFFAEEEEEEEEVTFFRGTGLARLVREGAAREVETTLITRDGRRVPVVFNGSVVRDAEGQLLAVVGVARDMTERKRQERRLAAQYAVTRIVAEFTTFDDAAPKILQAVCECLGWRVGGIWGVDRQANVLRLTNLWCEPSFAESDFVKVSRQITFAPGIGLPGRVWASGAPAWIADVVLDPNFPRAPVAVRSGLHAAFAFPIRLGNETLGVMDFFSSQVQSSDDALLAMMASIGSQIGVALERARLHEQVKAQRIEEQAALLRLSQALLAETDETAIVNLGVQSAAEALRVDFVVLALFDEATQTVSVRAAAHLPPEVLRQIQRLPLSSTPAFAHAIRSRAPVIVHNAPGEMTFEPPPWVAQAGIVSSIMSPMLAGREAIGGLMVSSRTRREWTDGEVRLLSLIANDTAQALERARLYTQAQERLERISALHDIDVAITSPLDLQATLDVLLEKVTERLGVDAAAVALAAAVAFIDRETRELVYAAKRGLDGEFFANGLLKVNEGIAGRVAHTGEVAAIPDVRAEPGFVRAAIAERLGIVSYLAVPLQARGEILGVLELATRQRHAFLPEEVDFFITLAGQAAIVIDNTRMYEEAVRRAAQQRALTENAGRILATLDTQALWPAAADAARQILAADRAAVYLYHAEADRVTCPYASGLSAEYVAEINRRFREIPGGRLLADPRPLASADAQSDPATAAIRDLAIREGFHSYAVFPLAAPGLPLGALVAYRDLVAPFTPDDLTAGQTLAHIVAVAVQNARLFEAERAARAHSETLQQVGALLTTHLGLDEVFERLFDLLARVVAYDSVSVQLTDEHGSMYLAAGRGFPDIEQAGSVVRDIHRAASEKQRRWDEGRPLVIPDTHADSGWLIAPGVEYIRSWVGAPLLVKGELIGVLNVDSHTVNAYDLAMGETVLAFANQAAIAIENARLFEAERAAHEQADLLREAARAVSSSLELDEVLHRILEQLKHVVAYNTASVLLLGEAGTPSLVTGIGYADEKYTSQESEDLLRSSPILRQMAHDLQPVVIPDVREHPGWIWVPGAEHVRAFLAVPVVVRNRMIGALMMDSVQPGFFKKTDAHPVQALAQHMAVAIENARLYQQANQHLSELEFLHRVTLAVAATPDLDAALAQVVTMLADELGYQHVGIALVDKARQSVDLRAEHGIPISDWGPAGQGVRVGQGLVGWVAQHGEPLLVNDVTRDPRYIVGIPETRSELVVPLRADGRVIGVINVESLQLDAFDAEDLRLLNTLAGQLANSIERARLFEATRRQLQELAVLHVVASAATEATGEDALIERATQVIGVAFFPDNFGLLLVDAAPNPLTAQGVLRIHPSYRGIRDEDKQFTIPLGEGITGRVAASGQPRRVADASREPAYLEASGGMRSELCVPLMAGDHILGVINAESARPDAFGEADERLLVTLAGQLATGIERARLFEAEQRRMEVLTALHETGLDLSAQLELSVLLDTIVERAARLLKVPRGGLYLLQPDGQTLEIVVSRHPPRDFTGLRVPLGEGVGGRVAQTGEPLIVEDYQTWPGRARAFEGMPIRAVLGVPIKWQGQVIGVINLDDDLPDRFGPADVETVSLFADQAAVAIVNARLFDETRRRAEELEALTEISAALRQAQTRAEMLPLLVEAAMQTLRADAGALILLEEESLVFAAARGPGEALLGQRHPPGDDPLWQIIRTGQPLFIADMSEHGELAQWEVGRALVAGMAACACIPLQTAEATIGLLHLACAYRREPTEQEKRLLTAIAEMAGSAIHRTALHEETEHRLQLVEALRNIDMAITASLDLRVTLNVFLDQAMAQLRVDAAAVLLLNPYTRLLEYAAGRGFRSKAIERSHLRLGEGHAGRAALERQAIHLPDLSQAEDYLRASFFRGEDFVGYYVTPLIVKGHVKGVFEMFHRAPLHLSPIWLSFLEALAAQVSIAIDNAGLYDDLQRSNVALTLAYEATLEGWAHALELRDRETEGHTQRVTEMAERLARAMGIAGESLVHIRRGSLLHDIGKMGVPDSILLKPGPLTNDEWKVMHLHPQLACDMLSPIAYLRPALDIPRYHHEKWDGTGYPEGLKGEAIPLAARIFAVVDVWDALRSDRPYRAAWPEAEVVEHIRQQAGKYFDPAVVETFLRLEI